MLIHGWLVCTLGLPLVGLVMRDELGEHLFWLDELPAAEELLVGWAVLVLGAGTGTTEESSIRLGAGTGRLLPPVTRPRGEDSSEAS